MVQRIKLLGKFTIEENGRSSPMMKYRKGCALLAYLIVTRESHSRETVADLLWNASSTAQSLGNLRKLLHQLRELAPGLQVTRQQLSYQPHDEVEIDLYTLEEGLASPNIDQLAESLPLYSEELISDLYFEDAVRFNEWLLVEREQLRHRVWEGYRRVCAAYEEQKLWQKGIDATRRWIKLDSLDEEIQRQLMHFLAANGQVEAALQQYESCRQELLAELRVEPDPATKALAVQLKQLQWPEPGQVAEPGPLPQNSFLPYHRNPTFIGRTSDLQQLATQLMPVHGSVDRLTKAAVITGMGGLGKTQLAVEYAYRYGRYYSGGVHWLSFVDAESVPEEFTHIGSERGLNLFQTSDNLKHSQRLAKVKKALHEPIPRLLIFDNCEDDQLAAEWLPTKGGCQVLITSQKPQLHTEIQAASIPLTTFSRSESIIFLQQFVKKISQEDASALAEEVGDWPLALQLAGHFLAKNKEIQLFDYLEQLKNKNLLQHASLQGEYSRYSPTRHMLHVARTFALSFDQFDSSILADQLAKNLLARAASFSPEEPIPKRLLLVNLSEGVRQQGLNRLLETGFLEEEEHSLVIHRLVTAFAKDVLDIGAAATVVENIIIAELEEFKIKDKTLLNLPFPATHLHYVAQNSMKRVSASAAKLATFWGRHLFTNGNYDAAKQYLKKALTIRQKCLEPNHPDTIKSLSLMGRLYYRLGLYEEAERLFLDVLHRRETSSKENRLEMALAFRDMGALHFQLGRYAKAKEYHQQELTLRQQQLGENHLLVAQSLSTMGAIYGMMGDNAECRVIQEKAIQIYKEIDDDNETVLARLLNNLGVVCTYQGDFLPARKCLEQCLQIRERIYAPDTLYVSSVKNSLGFLLMRLKEYESARPFLEDALAIRFKLFGKAHLHTAQSICNLGEWFLRTGKIEAAQKQLSEALKLQESIKPIHHQTADIKALLGETVIQKGDMASARLHLDHAVSIWQELKKDNSPEIAHAFIILGEWHLAMEEHKEAKLKFENALEILHKTVLSIHPDIQRAQQNLEKL